MHTKLPIINSYKNSSFRLSDFRRIWESFQIRNLMASCLSWHDQKFIRFSKSCLLGRQGFLFKRFQSGEECLSRWVITNSNHQFFQDPHCSKFENIFTHIFSFSFALGFILFLEATTKFMMTKGVQNKYIHFIHMLTSSNVYIFQKCIFKWKHLWSKYKQKLPLVDPLS